MTAETLVCSWAARSGRSRLSAGSRRTDSTEAAADPSGGRPPRTAQDLLDVAPLRVVGHRLDPGVGDRGSVRCVSVLRSHLLTIPSVGDLGRSPASPSRATPPLLGTGPSPPAPGAVRTGRRRAPDSAWDLRQRLPQPPRCEERAGCPSVRCRDGAPIGGRPRARIVRRNPKHGDREVRDQTR